MPLNDLEVHFCFLKPFYLPYLVKRSRDFFNLGRCAVPLQ